MLCRYATSLSYESQNNALICTVFNDIRCHGNPELCPASYSESNGSNEARIIRTYIEADLKKTPEDESLRALASRFNLSCLEQRAPPQT